MKYAVVGFGTAGYHAVKKIRELDKEGCIDVYSNTGRAPYNPMLTTYYAFGKLEYEGMFPFGDLEQIQKEVDFNLRKKGTGDQGSRIRTSGRNRKWIRAV